MSRPPRGRRREGSASSFYNGRRRHDQNFGAPPLAATLPSRPSSIPPHQGRPSESMSKNYRARAASQHRRIIPPNRSLTPTSSQPIAEVSKSRPWTSNQANASSSPHSQTPSTYLPASAKGLLRSRRRKGKRIKTSMSLRRTVSSFRLWITGWKWYSSKSKLANNSIFTQSLNRPFPLTPSSSQSSKLSRKQT